MKRIYLAMCMLISFVIPSFGSTIDFETLPDGSPTLDGMLIRNQYNVSPFWVKFELVGEDSLLGPRIAKVGPDRTAFTGVPVYSNCSGESSSNDKPASGQFVGCFFLTDDGADDSVDQYVLRVTYTYPVQQASGTLLDIDGTEEWTITALASDTSTVLDQILIVDGDPGTGDGLATTWAFDLGQDIYFIEISGEKFNGAPVGIAFDNFSPSSISADLSVTKDGPVGPLDIDSTLSYNIIVENNGPGDATNVIVKDALPPGLQLVSVTPSQGTWSETNGLITCDLGTIVNGSSATIAISGQLQQLYALNSVNVTADQFDSHPIDNVDSVLTMVNCNVYAVPALPYRSLFALLLLILAFGTIYILRQSSLTRSKNNT